MPECRVCGAVIESGSLCVDCAADQILSSAPKESPKAAKRNKKAYLRWTEQMEKQLVDMVDSGRSISVMAQTLGIPEEKVSWKLKQMRAKLSQPPASPKAQEIKIYHPVPHGNGVSIPGAQELKADAGKPELSFAPLEMLEPAAMVRKFAATKYGMEGIENWRKLSDERLFNAMLRHIVAHQHGEADAESGFPAIFHVAMNANFLAIKELERMKEAGRHD